MKSAMQVPLPWLLALCMLTGQPAHAQKAEPFTLPSLYPDRPDISLDDHAGQVIYLDFWSAWCAPCRDKLPAMQDLSRQFDDASVAVIAVSVDRVPDDARRFLASIDATFAAAMDPAAVAARDYGVEALPHAVLIDGDGRIHSVYRNGNYGDVEVIEREIRALLAKQRAAGSGRSAGRSLLARWGLAD